MMITKEEAEKKIHNRISKTDPSSPDLPEMTIVDDLTIEKEYGWVFFYQSKEYLESGRISDALAGNAPYIVNKNTGEIVETGTAHPIEYYLREYERDLVGRK